MMDVEIVIEGVSDVRLASEIRRKIRRVWRDTARAGEWSIAMYPSETRGQWDLGVRGPSGSCFASFTERLEQLPDLVAERLRSCCERCQ
jgi:hypothetical protein